MGPWAIPVGELLATALAPLLPLLLATLSRQELASQLTRACPAVRVSDTMA